MAAFEIPELPAGRILEVRLISNWGDPTFIGLNAIEIFCEDGERAKVEKIFSNATDITGHIESLLVESLTCKDVEKMWTANMISHNKEENKEPIKVTMEMENVKNIAMIRFWNYNASRVRAQIGVRQLEMFLDEKLIFQGEIDCAFSSDSEFEPQMGDTVLFTTSDQILEKIALNDICLIPSNIFPHNSPSLQNLTLNSTNKLLELTPYRPTTCETSTEKSTEKSEENPAENVNFEENMDNEKEKNVKVIHIELTANWGMRGLIGLTGIEIVDKNNRIVNENLISTTVSIGEDQQNVRRLFNGRNLTRNQEDMWLCEFPEKSPQKVTISLNFLKAISLRAISIWNYNGSFEMSYAGAKVANIFINGKLMMSNVLLRKATGFVYFDYVQDIIVDGNFGANIARPLTHTIGGFVFQVRLLSTWGDEFYVGLNGIELYNRKGELMMIREHNLAAFPESINILPQVKNDMRTSDNLVNGKNDTTDPRNMWLTAVLPNSCARVFFVFDTPTYISKMTIFNYRKTPERGVRHLSISVDDLIVFSGEVPISTADFTGKLDIDLQES